MSVFGLYSRYYDLLYRSKDYQSEAAFVAEHLESENVPSLDILELGCGTGVHAALLAKRGFRVHGIDFSAEMLEAAQQRRADLPPEAAARLTFASGDVRTYRHAAKFGAVVSLFHVFSYQTTNADLSAGFATAAEHSSQVRSWRSTFGMAPRSSLNDLRCACAVSRTIGRESCAFQSRPCTPMKIA